jgi:hypothetical protein
LSIVFLKNFLFFLICENCTKRRGICFAICAKCTKEKRAALATNTHEIKNQIHE